MKGKAAHKESEVAGFVTSCQKVRWPTEKAAAVALHDFTKNGSRKKKKPIRTYACDTCKGWHLTSQSANERENRQQLTRGQFKKLLGDKKYTRPVPADTAFEMLKKMRQQTIDELTQK